MYKSKKRNRLSKKNKNKRKGRKRTKMRGGFITFDQVISKIKNKINYVANSIIPVKKNKELLLFDNINSVLQLN